MNDELIGSAINSIFSTEGATTNPAHQQQQQAQQYKRPWVGLTEKEQDAVFKTFSRSDVYKKDFLNRVASAIEVKLKELNT